jgi:hypothetical protein
MFASTIRRQAPSSEAKLESILGILRAYQPELVTRPKSLDERMDILASLGMRVKPSLNSAAQAIRASKNNQSLIVGEKKAEIRDLVINYFNYIMEPKEVAVFFGDIFDCDYDDIGYLFTALREKAMRFINNSGQKDHPGIGVIERLILILAYSGDVHTATRYGDILSERLDTASVQNAGLWYLAGSLLADNQDHLNAVKAATLVLKFAQDDAYKNEAIKMLETTVAELPITNDHAQTSASVLYSYLASLVNAQTEATLLLTGSESGEILSLPPVGRCVYYGVLSYSPELINKEPCSNSYETISKMDKFLDVVGQIAWRLGESGYNEIAVPETDYINPEAELQFMRLIQALDPMHKGFLPEGTTATDRVTALESAQRRLLPGNP